MASSTAKRLPDFLGDGTVCLDTGASSTSSTFVRKEETLLGEVPPTTAGALGEAPTRRGDPAGTAVPLGEIELLLFTNYLGEAVFLLWAEFECRTPSSTPCYFCTPFVTATFFCSAYSFNSIFVNFGASMLLTASSKRSLTSSLLALWMSATRCAWSFPEFETEIYATPALSGVAPVMVMALGDFEALGDFNPDVRGDSP